MTDLIVKFFSTFLDSTPEVIGFSDLTEKWGVEAKLYYHLTNALLTSSKMVLASGCVFTEELILVTGKLPYAMNFLVPALFCLLVALLLKRGVGY